MRKKVLCKSCGYERWFGEQRVEFCPECGSNDLKLEIVPEVISQAISANSSRLDSIKSSELFKKSPDPLGLSSPFQSSKIQKSTRSGTGMSDGTKIRIVLGIIGIIMCFSALSIRSFTGIIAFLVIGFILLVIATKGEICN